MGLEAVVGAVNAVNGGSKIANQIKSGVKTITNSIDRKPWRKPVFKKSHFKSMEVK